MKKTALLAILFAVLPCTGFSQKKDCEELKTEIAARLDAKGVKGYELKIVAPGDVKGEIAITRPDAPPIVLLFDREAHLIGARNSVPSPEAGGAAIQQEIRFSGAMTSNGVHWPREIDIDQDGKPFFQLHLDEFEAR